MNRRKRLLGTSPEKRPQKPGSLFERQRDIDAVSFMRSRLSRTSPAPRQSRWARIETIVRVQARLRRRQEELYRAEPSNQWLVLGPERRVYATAQFCAPRRWCARKTRPSYGCETRSAAAAFEATASLRARDRQGRFAPPSARLDRRCARRSCAFGPGRRNGHFAAALRQDMPPVSPPEMAGISNLMLR